MNEWLKQHTAIKQEIQQKLSHSYLRKFIDKPEVDDTRLKLLMSPFRLEQLAAEEIRKYITTAMLIQIALDTHDKVTASSENIVKKQQLTVLAGDYFSGLYYQILADLKDIRMIRLLADAVKSINENKVVLYQKEHLSVDDLMDSVYKIESDIVERFYSFFGFQSLFETASHFLFVKRLLREKRLVRLGETAMIADSIRNLLFSHVKGQLNRDQEQSLVRTLDEYIAQAGQTANSAVKREQGNEQITRMHEMLSGELLNIKTLAEEG
ncbi:heptaprenyl diphosphate synthase component 1 [Bacillus xiapuensis]|uniref:heptaprenyl diphosphate synthase component 1 n=1 Tax=Bacillus xiapuensis TaxID=2014075 RepID=UPI000C245FD9|nr:heptaprenyl diphosphate synthase component 1 [Bacillus xiapuensis]